MPDPNFANQTLFHGDNLAFLRRIDRNTIMTLIFLVGVVMSSTACFVFPSKAQPSPQHLYASGISAYPGRFPSPIQCSNGADAIGRYQSTIDDIYGRVAYEAADYNQRLGNRISAAELQGIHDVLLQGAKSRADAEKNRVMYETGFTSDSLDYCAGYNGHYGTTNQCQGLLNDLQGRQMDAENHPDYPFEPQRLGLLALCMDVGAYEE